MKKKATPRRGETHFFLQEEMKAARRCCHIRCDEQSTEQPNERLTVNHPGRLVLLANETMY